MGRGRAKAKQTKVARDLKYRTHETDFGALANELHGDEHDDDTGQVDADELEKWSDYADSSRATDARTVTHLRPVDAYVRRSDRSTGVIGTPCARRSRAGDGAGCARSTRRTRRVTPAQPQPDARAGGRPRASGARRAGRRRSAGGDAVGRGELEHRAGGVEDAGRRAAGRARRRSPRARRRPGSGRRSSRSSRGRRGCRAPRAAFSMPGWASWLLAAPQTILAREHLDDLVGDRAAERARGVDVELARRPAPRSTATAATCGNSLADALDRRRRRRR